MTAASARPAAARITRFRKRPLALGFFLVLGLAILVQGAATAIYFWTSADSTIDPLLGNVAIGLGVFLAAVGLWFAANAGRRLGGAEDAIVIGPAGLHDRLLSAQPLPWRAIRNLHIRPVRRGRRILAFDLADDHGAGIHWWPRIGAPINRLFGYDFYVLTMGTDADVDSLVAAVTPFVSVRP